MSSELRGILAGKLPLTFVIGAFVYGFIILNCTPLRYFNKNLAIPSLLSFENPAQTSINIIVVFIVYLGLGVPFLVLSPIVKGYNGLNNRIMDCFRQIWPSRSRNTKEEEPKKEEQTTHEIHYFRNQDGSRQNEKEVEFIEWVSKPGHRYYAEVIDVNDIESEIVGGLIVASEVSLLFTIIGLAPASLLSGLDLTFFAWCIAIPGILFSFFVVFNHCYFRQSVIDTINALRNYFLSDSTRERERSQDH